MLAKTSPSDDTLILNALDVGIVILDRQGRIVLWNDWIARYTQTAASAVAGKTLVDVFPTLAATRLPSAVEDSFETGSSGLLTHSLNKLFPMHNEGGQELLHNVIVRPISSGPSQQCLLQVNDVTVAVTRERVLRERQNARYRAIVDTAPDAIITICLLYTSDAADE